MTEDLMNDLVELLRAANLSTYEINAFTVLVKSSQINGCPAREISQESNVPVGRIYEILDELESKGMIEVIDSHPKRYRSITFNKALDNLITHQTKENKRKISYLYQQAKMVESKLYNSEVYVKKEPAETFWTTAFGIQQIFAMYSKFCNETEDEILFNGFVNKGTLKILDHAHDFYKHIKNAVNRGVKVKTLWSFELDGKTLT
ncbi:MAG: TrmB family transcriptional regulator, partial [Candidatus Odinarchaeota archaeon]